MELTQDQAFAEIEAMMGTVGWKVFEQHMIETMLGDTNSILALKRPDGQNDDHLRGRVDMVKYVVMGLKKRIAEFKANRELEKSAPTVDLEGSGDPYPKVVEQTNSVQE